VAKANDRAQFKRILDTDLSKLLKSPLVTTLQMQALLEAAQKNGKKVNKTAKDKDTLVEENLRKAVASGDIPIEAVHALLEDSEEHDSQYHYFYSLNDNNDALRLDDLGACGKALIGKDWTQRGFPLFLAKPQGEEWGDLRIFDAGKSWVAKLYWGDQRWILNVDESKDTATRRVKVWTPEYAREVWLIRWHSRQQLLEISLPRLGSREDQKAAKEALWVHLSKLVQQNHVADFSLSHASTVIVNEPDTFKDELHLGGPARLMSEDGGSTIMCPHSKEQGLLDSPDRSAAIKHYKRCNELCMFWQPTKATDAIPANDEVKTIIGHWGVENSLLFTAKNSGKTVRHVTNRLLEIELQGRNGKAAHREN
jgi:hypothetical protein